MDLRNLLDHSGGPSWSTVPGCQAATRRLDDTKQQPWRLVYITRGFGGEKRGPEACDGRDFWSFLLPGVLVWGHLLGPDTAVLSSMFGVLRSIFGVRPHTATAEASGVDVCDRISGSGARLEQPPHGGHWSPLVVPLGAGVVLARSRQEAGDRHSTCMRSFRFSLTTSRLNMFSSVIYRGLEEQAKSASDGCLSDGWRRAKCSRRHARNRAGIINEEVIPLDFTVNGAIPGGGIDMDEAVPEHMDAAIPKIATGHANHPAVWMVNN